MQKDYRKRLPSFGATTLALSLLSGCASNAPQAPRVDTAEVKQFAGRGYLTDDRYNVATTFATWKIGERSFDLAFTVPAKQGAFPLLIYLPALGEGRSAGDNLRTAWAQAGYAVMSLQPIAKDANAWSSESARIGDFSALARDRYSAAAMTARLEALRTILGEFGKHYDEAPLDRIDLTRTAVIGYDIGAYTAMVIAGENLPGVPGPALPVPIKAVIALSPYSGFSGAAFEDRYNSIKGPVLSVTSDIDTDSLGLVTSPSVRKAPFQYMPAGDKYLLALANIPHGAIGGGSAGASEEDSRSGSPAAAQGGNGKRGGRRHGGNGQDSDSAQDDMPSFGNTASPTSRAIGLAAIASVTTAFLDTYVKKDSFAQEWLDKDARRWLGKRGEISRK